MLGLESYDFSFRYTALDLAPSFFSFPGASGPPGLPRVVAPRPFHCNQASSPPSCLHILLLMLVSLFVQARRLTPLPSVHMWPLSSFSSHSRAFPRLFYQSSIVGLLAMHSCSRLCPRGHGALRSMLPAAFFPFSASFLASASVCSCPSWPRPPFSLALLLLLQPPCNNDSSRVLRGLVCLLQLAWGALIFLAAVCSPTTVRLSPHGGVSSLFVAFASEVVIRII